MRRGWCLLLLLLACLAPVHAEKPPLALRGYYITFMRMPTFGLGAWKETVDCVRSDGGNTLILWTAGGFRSRKFPQTWQYNREHENVRRDFLRKLIDYAHTRGVKVLLGLTPFGYDGVNRMPLLHPEWKATGPDGKPVHAFGIGCWGYNLCPAREDTQKFMWEYVREMYFGFYPNADGLFIESSDYAVCHCPECGAHFFDNEFRFVRGISEDVWHRKPGAMVVVYPHYFTGARVPGLNVTAARQPFDPRWTVFFTPRSANPDAELIRKASASIWWDDAPAMHTPWSVRDGARKAVQLGCRGYLPSLEGYSYVATEPEEGQQYLVGRRQAPFGYRWLAEGQMPYRELPIRIQRIAYREFTRNPQLSDKDFKTILGEELFGTAATARAVDDALWLQALFVSEKSWCQAAPLADPERVRAMKLTPEKRAEYARALVRVREIEARYRGAGKPVAQLHRLAQWLADQWRGENAALLLDGTPATGKP